MREGADPNFVWTDEDKERVARSSLAVEAVRRGHLSGEEALAMVIAGKPDTPEYMAAIERRIKEISFHVPAGRKTSGVNHRERERERYHTDAEYRERCLARHRAKRQTPEYKAKERERARRRRAARRAS